MNEQNNKKMNYDELSLWFLLDDDDDLKATVAYKRYQRKMHKLLQNRATEGAFNILVKRYLFDDDTKFKAYYYL